MIAAELRTRLGELQGLHGEAIPVRINHAEIVTLVYVPTFTEPTSKEVFPAYFNIVGV